MMPDRLSIIIVAVLYTIAYAIVMWLAIHLKRKWRRSGVPGARPEDLLLAIYSYFATVPLNIAISLILRHGQLTYAPFLFALNQTILGYFISQYIDRSLNRSEVSVGLAAVQGMAQAVCAVIATTLSPSVFSPTIEIFDVPIATFASIQAGVSGFIISILFQRLYRRSSNLAVPSSLAVLGSAP